MKSIHVFSLTAALEYTSAYAIAHSVHKNNVQHSSIAHRGRFTYSVALFRIIAMCHTNVHMQLRMKKGLV